MQKPIERPSPALPVLLGLIALLLLFLFGVALCLGLDMYDTYEIFLNSRLIAGDPGGWYFPTRAFMTPLIFSPVFFFARHFAADPASFALTACHFVSMVLTTATVWAVYRIFRIHLNRIYSVLGAALLVFNPLIIHAAPISKEDIPGALFTTWTFFFYLRYWKTGRLKYGVLTALFVSITMGTRYNVIPLLPIVMAAHELLNPRTKLRLTDFLRKATLLTLAPTLLWLLVPSLLYFGLGGAEFFEAPGAFISDLYHASIGAVGSEMGYPEYPWENLVFLVRSFSIPVFALALWGMAAAWRRKTPGGLFHGLWLGVFLAFHSFALGHKEARYLFCLFPPLYFFAVLGIMRLVALCKSPAARVAALTVVLGWPAYGAVAECLKFFDPFYRVNFARDVSRYAASLAGSKEIWWLGPFYAMHPREYLFDAEDEVTYLYHVYVHTVRYYTGKPMRGSPMAMQFSAPGGPQQGVFPPPQQGIRIAEGDAVILNPEPNSYVTKSVPETLKPLIVERAHILEVAQNGDTRLAVRKTTVGTELKTGNLAAGSYAIYFTLSNGQSGTAGEINMASGQQTRVLPEKILPTGTRITKLWLLSFDSVKLFTAPTE